jgi:hypothetical protein
MQLSEIYLRLGEDAFQRLVRSISLGRLRTYQLFDPLKARLHLSKLNAELLRKAAPRMWTRLASGDHEFAAELAQAILVSHMEMIRTVLNELGVPHEDGFFAKDTNVSQYLTDGWQQRVWEKFHSGFAPEALQFYINHLGWETARTGEVFAPTGSRPPG